MLVYKGDIPSFFDHQRMQALLSASFPVVRRFVLGVYGFKNLKFRVWGLAVGELFFEG